MRSPADIAMVVDRTVFREVNDRLSSLNAALSYLLPSAAVVCECANARCATVIEVPIDVYEAVRRTPRRFVVAAGREHVTASSDRVVLQDAGYWIVEALAPWPPSRGPSHRSVDRTRHGLAEPTERPVGGNSGVTVNRFS